MDITNHPASDVIHVCNRSQESRIVAFMFTKRQLDGWRGYWDLSTSGNSCHEPTQRPDLGSEEVGRHEDIEMRADELLPCRGGLTLGGGWNTVALQDVTDGLSTDRQAQVGEGADDPIVAPRAVFLGHADHQGLQLWVNGGTSWSLAPLGAVELLGHQCTVPAENRVGLDDRRHVLQSLLAKSVANLRQGRAFAVAQPDTPCELA